MGHRQKVNYLFSPHGVSGANSTVESGDSHMAGVWVLHGAVEIFACGDMR